MSSKPLFGSAPSKTRRDEVYVTAVPLRAAAGPGQLLMSTAYSLKLWDLQHFMVILKRPSTHNQDSVLVFDFQPQDPENINVAIAALSGRKVPGVVTMRKMKKLPKTKCWMVGSCNPGAVDLVQEFNRNWETDLRIGDHDCRDYTNGLVECLTGEKYVLHRLRRSI